MEHMHWTYDDLLSQPADLIDELIAKLVGQSKAERRRARTEAPHGRR
jgi:hypothetical protein